MTSRGRVVLVDVYRPSQRLAPKFREAGYECVRVQSTVQVPRVYRESPYRAADFVDDIVHEGDFDATVDRVAAHDPVAVLAGGEVGVEFADLLGERLGTPSNGTRLSAARRDKFLMVEALRAAGTPAGQQLLVTDEEQLRSWHETIGRTVVLKPTRSAASVGVTFCDTPEESVRAYRVLAAAESVFSESNAGVVAQEYLRGTEYMINTVSCDGRHVMCDIWKTTRVSLNGARDLVDGIYLVPARGDVQDALVGYCHEVLDALGIRLGMAHIEVRMTPDGPRLVEIGARMAGADIPHYAELGLGRSQLDWAVDAYVRPDVFHARAGEVYTVHQFYATIPMLSPYDGALKEYRHLDAIEALESFQQVLFAVRPGGVLRRTVDDMTIPVAVNLMHEVEEIVHRDSRTVRYYDGMDFYQLDGADPALPDS